MKKFAPYHVIGIILMSFTESVKYLESNNKFVGDVTH